jgi:hypothetical protein
VYVCMCLHMTDNSYCHPVTVAVLILLLSVHVRSASVWAVPCFLQGNLWRRRPRHLRNVGNYSNSLTSHKTRIVGTLWNSRIGNFANICVGKHILVRIGKTVRILYIGTWSRHVYCEKIEGESFKHLDVSTSKARRYKTDINFMPKTFYRKPVLETIK